MGNFILGILITLAVIYPMATKAIVGNAVDTTHNVVTNVMSNTAQIPTK